jgi:cell wall-associated NlpC family hydrolase
MSLKPHIRSHRKPRRRAVPAWVVRTGVAGGALGTIVSTSAASAPAVSDAPRAAETTAELPAVTLSSKLASGIEQSADLTQQAALRHQLAADENEAIARAREDAAEAKKAAEERKAAAEAKAKREAAQRASRAADRETLSTTAADAGSSAIGSSAALIGFLKAQVGKAYVMGATGPSAYDCSGLTQAAYRTVGVNLPRTSQEQSTTGTQIPVSQVQPGDLLFWGGVGSANHVAVYIGDGKYLDAANPSKGVVIQEMSYYMPTSATRVL